MRKFLFALLLLLGVVLIIGRFTEIEAIFDTLQKGDWRFLLLALVIQLAWLVNVAASYRAIYRAMGVNEKIENLFLMATAANFVNVVAPTAGVGGVAVLISEARRQGYSSARATVGGVLYLLFDYAGFLCILVLGFIVLLRRDNLNAIELLASGVLIVIAAFMTTLLYLGMRSQDELASVLAWLVRRVNRLLEPFIHRPYLSELHARAFAHDASQGLREVRHSPENLFFPAALALSNKALLISILSLMFMAFDVPLSVGTLIAGFSIGYLFFIVSPTPSGIGFVEGALTLALGSMYIPLGAAAVVALAYRGITFWVPLAVGGMAFRYLHRS
ncbi:MAG TPA: lysylphosphatidylglycerol synthase transmembrane domain-containing protein [Anaerolineales bacterium]